MKILSKTKKYLTKKVIIPAALVLALAGGAVSFPYIQTAYKKHKAKNLIVSAEKEFADFRVTLNNAKQIVKNNEFLMTGPEETAPLYAEIKDSESYIEGLEEALSDAKSDFSTKDYDDVRRALDPKFGLKNQTRATPAGIIMREKNDLQQKVINYCNEKRNARNAVVDNEWYLKARLKKPMQPGIIEKTGELAEIPPKFFNMIPVLTPDLEAKLREFNPEQGGEINPPFYNSMGANLVKHKAILEHIIEFGKTEEIKNRAKNMYFTAFDSYRKVMPLNDELVWYRAEKHDGKYSMESYKDLLARQNKPINFIHKGDNALASLDQYYKELHEQYFIYLSSQTKKDTTFTHIDTDVTTDSNGNLKTETHLRVEPGYKFYYILTTVTPAGSKNEEIYVGEEEGAFASWRYKQDEQVGWVRGWKRLHFDNTSILSGWQNALNPKIEKLMPECRRK